MKLLPEQSGTNPQQKIFLEAGDAINTIVTDALQGEYSVEEIEATSSLPGPFWQRVIRFSTGPSQIEHTFSHLIDLTEPEQTIDGLTTIARHFFKKNPEIILAFEQEAETLLETMAQMLTALTPENRSPRFLHGNLIESCLAYRKARAAANMDVDDTSIDGQGAWQIPQAINNWQQSLQSFSQKEPDWNDVFDDSSSILFDAGDVVLAIPQAAAEIKPIQENAFKIAELALDKQPRASSVWRFSSYLDILRNAFTHGALTYQDLMTNSTLAKATAIAQKIFKKNNQGKNAIEIRQLTNLFFDELQTAGITPELLAGLPIFALVQEEKIDPLVFKPFGQRKILTGMVKTITADYATITLTGKDGSATQRHFDPNLIAAAEIKEGDQLDFVFSSQVRYGEFVMSMAVAKRETQTQGDFQLFEDPTVATGKIFKIEDNRTTVILLEGGKPIPTQDGDVHKQYLDSDIVSAAQMYEGDTIQIKNSVYIQNGGFEIIQQVRGNITTPEEREQHDLRIQSETQKLLATLKNKIPSKSPEQPDQIIIDGEIG